MTPDNPRLPSAAASNTEDSVEPLIANGEWSELLDLLAEQWETLNEDLRSPDADFDSDEQAAEFRRQLFEMELLPWLTECFSPRHGHNNRCALLAAWQTSQTDVEKTGKRLREALSETRTLLQSPDLLAPLGLRLEMMARFAELADAPDGAIDDGPAPSGRSELLKGWLEQIREHLGCRQTPPGSNGSSPVRAPWMERGPALDRTRCPTRPAAVLRLGESLAADFASAVRAAYRVQADESHPWRDPAIAFLADTLVQLHRESPYPWTPRNGHLQRNNDWGEGHSWILISVDDPEQTSIDPAGLLLLLRIDTIPNGCGAFYPDPDFCGSFRFHHSFQEGLRNAWHVIVGTRPEQSGTPPNKTSSGEPGDPAYSVDYRWSVTCMLGEGYAKLRGLLLCEELTGRSGELATALALRSVIEETPVDPETAATACFAGPLADFGDNPRLTAVGGVTNKHLGLSPEVNWDAVQRGQSQWNIRTILLAKGHNFEGFLKGVVQRRSRLQTAWGQVACDSRQTRDFNIRCREACHDFFCRAVSPGPPGGASDRLPRKVTARENRSTLGGYIFNDLIRLDAPLAGSKSNNRVETRIDTREHSDELLQVVEARTRRIETPGQQPAYRRVPLRITADSGYGKTALLKVIQWTVAGGRDGRIAVHLEGLDLLSDGQNRESLQDPESFLRLAAKRAGIRSVAWLRRKSLRGEVVWLLEGAAGTGNQTDLLVQLAGYFPQCDWLMTIRTTAVDAARPAWEPHPKVDELQLQPFRIEQAREYLGPHADPIFKVLNKADLAPGGLLTVPLMLFLLRQSAEQGGRPGIQGQLPVFSKSNRYSLCHSILSQVGGLVDYGRRRLQEGTSADDPEMQFFRDRHSVLDLYAQLGWWHVQSLAHTATLSSAHRDQWLRSLRDFFRKLTQMPIPAWRLIQALKQINLHTAMSADHSATGNHHDEVLSWRHATFFEFFGGRRLAEFIAVPGARAEEAVAALKKIHATKGDQDTRVDWWWTLRFAVCHACTLPAEPAGLAPEERLALELVNVGNAQLVWECIQSDGVQIGRSPDLKNRPVELLIRWLMYRDPPGHRYLPVVNEAAAANWPVRPGEISPQLADLRRNSKGNPEPHLHDREYFSPATLDALYELDCVAQQVSRWAPGTDWIPLPQGTTPQPAGPLSDAEQSVVSRFLDSLLPLPAGFSGNATAAESDWAPLSISRFFVTNELFQIFAKRWRFRNVPLASQPDHPVVMVSWYAARSFCEWLTRCFEQGLVGSKIDVTAWTGSVFCLPTMAEWEWAITNGGECDDVYWWGPQYKTEMDWFRDSPEADEVIRPGPKTQEEAADLARKSGAEHPLGLLSPVGNLSCWCADLSAKAPTHRALKGASSTQTTGRITARTRKTGHQRQEHGSLGIGFRVLRKKPRDG